MDVWTMLRYRDYIGESPREGMKGMLREEIVRKLGIS